MMIAAAVAVKVIEYQRKKSQVKEEKKAKKEERVKKEKRIKTIKKEREVVAMTTEVCT
jgi:endonuclease V-like protein UPF0215 family